MQSRKFRTIIALSMVLLIALAACSSKQEPTATPEPLAPTQAPEPTAEPTQETSVAAVEVEAADLAALTSTVWSWQSFTNPVETFEVDDPASYLLTFMDDGTVNINCNGLEFQLSTRDLPII